MTLRGIRLLASCAALAAAGAAAAPASAAPACPVSYGAADGAKPNKLYLYFPAVADSTYPEFSGGTGTATSPAQTFDVSRLSSYTGTAAALRDATTDVVADDYCEFNVKVLQTTTAPPATFARRNTVAIGTDANVSAGSATWGLAQSVDTGDPTTVDFAREWAGTYQSRAGGPGGALNGVDSTLERWARSIGGTAAHEAGHSYGLSHADGAVVNSGEDALTRHLMPMGSLLSDAQRAEFRRHHNDQSFSILASNVGLSIQTMHNWDLTNPNAAQANKFRLTFLSPNTSVISSWTYDGDRSPWTNPTVTSLSGTTVFKGTTYHRFQITWSTPQTWTGGAPGAVPGGGQFHVGATFSGVDFNQPDPIIITKSELLTAAGTPLALQPRLVGYDAGTLDSADGSFDVALQNFGRALIVRDVSVALLPRVMSIDSMLRGAPIRDWTGEAFRPWPESQRTIVRKDVKLPAKRGISLTVAELADARHILERVSPKSCRSGDATREPDTRSCRPGVNVDLFPATTMFIKATVVDPKAKHWVRAKKRYVVGPVESTVYYQVGGIHPDLNRNRVDDAIDIFTGKSRDRNHDGVPDEVKRKG